MQLFQYTELLAKIARELCIKPLDLIKQSLDEIVEKHSTSSKLLPLLIKTENEDLIVEHQKSPRFVNSGELVPEYTVIEQSKFSDVELDTIKNLIDSLQQHRSSLNTVINRMHQYCVNFTIFVMDNDISNSLDTVNKLFTATCPKNILKDESLMKEIGFYGSFTPNYQLPSQSEEQLLTKLKECLEETGSDISAYQSLQDMYNLRLLFEIN